MENLKPILILLLVLSLGTACLCPPAAEAKEIEKKGSKSRKLRTIIVLV